MRAFLERPCNPRAVLVAGFLVLWVCIACLWAISMFGPQSFEIPRDITPATAPGATPAPLNGTGRP